MQYLITHPVATVHEFRFVNPARCYQMFRVLFFGKGLRGPALRDELTSLYVSALSRGNERAGDHYNYIINWLRG